MLPVWIINTRTKEYLNDLNYWVKTCSKIKYILFQLKLSVELILP